MVKDEDIMKTVDKLFQQYDTDNSNSLTQDQLKQIIQDVFAAMGDKRKVNLTDVKKVLSNMDANNDGVIQRAELFAIIKSVIQKQQ